MVLYCIGEYYTVVKIDESRFPFDGGQYYSHRPLERCWWTFQAEWHAKQLVDAVMTGEGLFSLSLSTISICQYSV